MSGAILPLPQYAFMAWCLVKHRDFTFTFTNCCTYHELDPVAYSNSELTSETMTTPSSHFGRTPRTGDRPIARPLLTQDSTTQRNEDIHLHLEQDSNPRSQSIRPS
jgi:hypothetical protein